MSESHPDDRRLIRSTGQDEDPGQGKQLSRRFLLAYAALAAVAGTGLVIVVPQVAALGGAGLAIFAIALSQGNRGHDLAARLTAISVGIMVPALIYIALAILSVR